MTTKTERLLALCDGATPGEWLLGEYDEYLGYDCMTGGIRTGPAVLDGADYGQKRCSQISAVALARMESDAGLIAALNPAEVRAMLDLMGKMREALDGAAKYMQGPVGYAANSVVKDYDTWNNT